MKPKFILAATLVFVALVGTGLAQSFAVADKNGDQGRNVTGQVLTKSDAPLPEAIVYLKNTKTLTIKSFITEKDGGYRFQAPPKSVDYEISADNGGKKFSKRLIFSLKTQ